MNQKRFASLVLIIIVAALVLGTGGYFYLHKNLPSCPTDLGGVFSQSLVDPERIVALAPLGFTNGQEHILPVDHSYFTFNAASPDAKIPVYSPGKITLTNISSHIDYDADGKPYTNIPNYMLSFEVCRGVTGWIEWVHELSPQLKNIFDNARKTHNEGPLNGGARAVNTSLNLNITLNAGDLIGWTGAQPSLAVSIFDSRSKRNDVNLSYYSDADRRSAICFTDLYTGDLKKTLTDKYGSYIVGSNGGIFTPRTGEPRCGQVIQNINGTVQGDWFANKPTKEHENLEAEGKTISFIHYYLDPTIDVISIGGNIFENPRTAVFKPARNGTVNHEFSETKAGEIYCYQTDQVSDNIIFAKRLDGHILVQLMDAEHLQVEAQTGSCTGQDLFKTPFLYER